MSDTDSSAIRNEKGFIEYVTRLVKAGDLFYKKQKSENEENNIYANYNDSDFEDNSIKCVILDWLKFLYK